MTVMDDLLPEAEFQIDLTYEDPLDWTHWD